MDVTENKEYILNHEDILKDPEIVLRFPKKRIAITSHSFSEIGRVRKSKGMKAENAQDFNHLILSSMNGRRFSEGIKLDNGSVIRLLTDYSAKIPPIYKNQDYDLIKAALALKEQNIAPIVVTDDDHLRLVSRELGIEYNSVPPLNLYSGCLRIDNLSKLCVKPDESTYSGRHLPVVSSNLEDFLKLIGECIRYYYSLDKKTKSAINVGPIKDLADELGEDLYPNEFIVFSPRPEDIFRYESKTKKLVPPFNYYQAMRKIKGLQAKNAEQVMALELLLNPEIESVTIAGVAGTGKNFLVAAAASYMLNQGLIQNYFITKPNEELGKGHGYLPGELDEKVRPLLGSFEDNWNSVRGLTLKIQPVGQSYFEDDFESGIIQSVPFAYIQGRTLEDGIQHLDEGQLVGRSLTKVWWSRAGNNTKLVITGDISMDQILNENRQSIELSSFYNGLTIAAKAFKNDPSHGHICLYEVVRSRNSRKAQLLSR